MKSRWKQEAHQGKKKKKNSGLGFIESVHKQ